MTTPPEREFLRLACDWMVCRLVLLGHPPSRKGQVYDPCSWMIGELATQSEMYLVCKEMRRDNRTVLVRQAEKN
jgi:hypothetical protein